MKINVVGLGYIGLPTAITMANAGFNVIGTDYNKSIVETLQKKQITFKEEGLEDIFFKAVDSGNLTFSTEYADADVYIVSVPTPYDSFSKKVDASYVVKATETVLSVCKEGSIIVIESTVSPGTIDAFIKPIINKNVH